jgi:hypothetical protein
MVLRVARAMAFNSSWSVMRVWASTEAKGSSISITWGLAARVRATATRCFIPPDNSWGYFCSNPVRPTSSTNRRTVAARSALGTPWISRPWPMFRSTVRHGMMANS